MVLQKVNEMKRYDIYSGVDQRNGQRLYDDINEDTDDNGQWVKYDDVKKFKRHLDALMTPVEALADEPCRHGDDCPIFGTKQYLCKSCAAKKILESIKGDE